MMEEEGLPWHLGMAQHALRQKTPGGRDNASDQSEWKGWLNCM